MRATPENVKVEVHECSVSGFALCRPISIKPYGYVLHLPYLSKISFNLSPLDVLQKNFFLKTRIKAQPSFFIFLRR